MPHPPVMQWASITTTTTYCNITGRDVGEGGRDVGEGGRGEGIEGGVNRERGGEGGMEEGDEMW